MFANRISDYFDAPSLTPTVAIFQPAFIACPAPLMATFSAAQHAFVAEVYRRAQELTESQLRKPARRPLPQFSLN
jgi:hypothetical protein